MNNLTKGYLLTFTVSSIIIVLVVYDVYLSNFSMNRLGRLYGSFLNFEAIIIWMAAGFFTGSLNYVRDVSGK